MQKYIPGLIRNFLHKASDAFPAYPINKRSAMKNTSLPCFELKRATRCALAILAASLALTCQDVGAQIIADFTHGDSDTEVDAYRGAAGDGWVGKWTKSANGGSTHVVTTSSKNPLTTSGGLYLESTLTKTTGTNTPSGVISRQYESYETIDLTQEHTVSFEFRLDGSLSDLNRLMFFDGEILSRDSSGANPTWFMRYDPSYNDIALYNGTSPVRTEVPLVADQVYRFTIHITPSQIASQSTYSVLIENLTTSTSKLFDSLKFYTPKSSTGGYLNFSGSVVAAEGSNVTFSLDSIHITAAIPEPSSLALIGLVIGGAWLIKRRPHL